MKRQNSLWPLPFPFRNFCSNGDDGAVSAAGMYGALLFLIFATSALPAQGQTDTTGVQPSGDTTAAEYINIRFADIFTNDMESGDTLQKLTGHVELNQDTLFLF
ncbi:MAG: hypothetical protein ACE5FF_05880, partial [Saprospiraceae bacterium]